jgi:hypothetical protein
MLPQGSGVTFVFQMLTFETQILPYFLEVTFKTQILPYFLEVTFDLKLYCGKISN